MLLVALVCPERRRREDRQDPCCPACRLLPSPVVGVSHSPTHLSQYPAAHPPTRPTSYIFNNQTERVAMKRERRALTKLLLSVDWGVDSEVAQVDGLLAEWARRAPIEAPDALKLLGRERTFQAEVVRRFAVDALRRASDDELLAFLLQLVQALRYQQVGGAAGAGGPGGGNDGGGAAATPAGVEDPAVDGGGGGGGGVSPLAQFLIERACRSLKLANFFYWYLRVELEDATHGHIYRGVQAAFQRAMGRAPESARVLGETRPACCSPPSRARHSSAWYFVASDRVPSVTSSRGA